MTFFDEISKNLTGYGKEAARKAKDAAQVLQLKARSGGKSKRSMNCILLLVQCILKTTEKIQKMNTKCSSLRSKCPDSCGRVREKTQQLDTMEKMSLLRCCCEKG